MSDFDTLRAEHYRRSFAVCPEVRYDVHGTATYYENFGRFRGLLAGEASALSDALYHDLPGSPCLLTLRKRWAERASWEGEDEEPTRVDELTYGQRLARETGQTGIRKW